ncbi:MULTISPECIES: RNA-binding protein [unclassified Sedimentibacter]|uniref:YlmH family RNA-binding protein n=1 Tax=unclassified Sedimentibacter TaxID=2649220 RepID=UPI0027E14617|nr:YlmH/Sll1252 family protein [Sedimentibacter sp. MB35-C1]WMJ75989.1 YlmH/Sll1252 family protein [Sedimentibacter sp. MB35-C1]
MKNFEKYYDFIKDEETRNSVRRIAEKSLHVSKKFVVAVTEFTNPYIAELSLPTIKNYDIKFEIFPSFEYSERKVFVLYPDYLDNIEKNEFVTGIRIYNRSKFKKLNHKDYLGALMSLGIARNKTGDIYVYDNYADIVLHNDISDYILYNLDKIGHNKIEAEKISLDEINYKEQEHVIMNITSSSLRIDNIVKHITNKSREAASGMIKSGNVKINWQVEERVSSEVKENDMISISRYGRYKISGLFGLTKSGKLKIEIKHYI